MKALGADLEAAQRERAQRPYVEHLTALDRRWGVSALVPEILYAAAPQGQPFAACIAADGSLCRIRISPAGDVSVQRIPDPATASTTAWGAWTLLGAGIANSQVPPAMAGGSSYTNLLYTRPDGYTLVRRFSSNNGASWSGEIVVASDAAAPVRAAAAAARAGTDDRVLLWASGPDLAGSAAVQLRYRTLSPTGTAGAITTATVPAFWDVEGLACTHGGDWHVAVAGQSGAGDHSWGVFLTLMGDGAAAPADSWLGLAALQRAEAATAYRYSAPSLLEAAGTWRCAYWARHPGGPDRMDLAHRAFPGFGPGEWTAPAPSGTLTEPALLAGGAGTALLAGERAAWSAGLPARSAELTGRLRSYRLRSPGGLSLVLSDADGASGSPELAPLAPGAGVRLSRGLWTAGGPMAVPLHEHEVVSVRWEAAAGERLLRVECRDALGALGAVRANRSYAWERSAPAHAILTELCAVAGLALTLPGALSAQATRTPAFEVAPNEGLLSAIRRLLEQLPERLRPEGAGLELADPESASAGYAYGSEGHPLLAWTLETGALEPNHAQAYGRRGSGVYGEALDGADIARTGHGLFKLLDPALGTAAEAAGLAEAVLAVARRRARRGELRAMPHLGLELWDRVEIRPAPGSPPEARTATACEERYDPARGEWLQIVTLGE